MSEHLEELRARDRLRQFIKELSASTACNSQVFGIDSELKVPMTVSFAQALDVFLRLHPELASYRDHLKSDSGNNELNVSKERWMELSPCGGDSICKSP